MHTILVDGGWNINNHNKDVIPTYILLFFLIKIAHKLRESIRILKIKRAIYVFGNAINA